MLRYIKSLSFIGNRDRFLFTIYSFVPKMGPTSSTRGQEDLPIPLPPSLREGEKLRGFGRFAPICGANLPIFLFLPTPLGHRRTLKEKNLNNIIGIPE
jgi:hypothetical protein